MFCGGQLITLSLPNGVELELGCDNLHHFSLLAYILLLSAPNPIHAAPNLLLACTQRVQ
jgi:hypothetical protein